jgi:hypothetical protein
MELTTKNQLSPNHPDSRSLDLTTEGNAATAKEAGNPQKQAGNPVQMQMLTYTSTHSPL